MGPSTVTRVSGERGLGWWLPPTGPPLFLLVDGGRVVDCTPYAVPWARGATAGRLLARAEREHAIILWAPLGALPTRFQPHLRHDLTPLRRWRREPVNHLSEHYLTFGQAGNGWFINETDEPHGWLFSTEADAWTAARHRMGAGTWERVPARYGPGGALPDVETW